uniref:UPAR/Ly6 domain-containing protein n=1 Tax=Lates calcarifer TaxID=8187 RepID=A0A4W6C8P6_LATCA
MSDSILYFCAACGIRCYTCQTTNPKTCTDILNCTELSLNRCFSLNVDGLITKGCINRGFCGGSMFCCEGDLCNSAIAIGPSVILLLVSSAIITLFL